MGNPKVKHKRDLAYAKEFVATMKRRGLSRSQAIMLIDEADASWREDEPPANSSDDEWSYEDILNK